ncbi:Set1/Ash2 histone methyltransferase complex subunit ASH2 [Babesia microti strain RI]|uniref:Set1/Ash2 histone methyltransferase complex subunit ASH2 n=1 Tax=Babesia microti (strain RI) TaxID=1133968 RepID=I7I812_BABMR|nr:Set1/Ash2 histone methyltransferase complex subunit ASH2 [Babesia microti strain RI]CCF72793.1 Set1/Ash2 histone methyltransferase complex subunit ASH2 [Babesia microti strain RI]|eukprot:XP_012647402.1 Set1/Ash2 histone methyltransferase complex subunit ASH2 [Babesia microti strain RI]
MGYVMHILRYKDDSITLEGNKIIGYKGWITCLANLAAQHGNWYFEVHFHTQFKELQFIGNPLADIPKPALRVGWACRYQRYDTPLGINNFSIGYSSVDGSCVRVIRDSYAIPYNPGDIVGCYLHIPNNVSLLPDPRNDHKLYEFLQGGMLCDPQFPPDAEVIPESYVKFSVNGVDQGLATHDLLNGCYHPAISLFMGAIATFNFGPNFKYDPGPEFLPCANMKPPEIP